MKILIYFVVTLQVLKDNWSNFSFFLPANLLLGNSVKINLRYFAQLISSLPLGDKGKKGWPAASYIRLDLLRLWQYGLWSFQTKGIKLERFLPKNRHTQRKLLSFENWVNGEVLKIGHHFSKESDLKIDAIKKCQ